MRESAQEDRVRHENREIGKASGILAFCTLVSRILGLARNQILSHFFGAGVTADAFIAAFTIPNALRRLLGEGALSPTFVSLFLRQLHGKEGQADKSEWQSFISSSFFWLTVISFGCCVVGMIVSPWLVGLYVPDFKDIPGKFELTVQLTRLLFPFLIFVTWAALFMAILNSFRRFALAASGQTIQNAVVVVLSILILPIVSRTAPEWAIYIYGGTILIGSAVMVASMLPLLKSLDAHPRRKFNIRDSRAKELLLLLVPSLFSLGVYQLNIIINRVFASDIPGAVSHLYYADLVIELPVSMVATSMSVASVPSFTRLIVEGNRKALGDTFAFSMGLNFCLALPAMAGIILLGTPIISSIFYSGRFEATDLWHTIECLYYYALGIPSFCLLRSLLPIFFAEKDTRTPAITSFIALLVNLVCAYKLSHSMGAKGIALATTLSSTVNLLILLAVSLWRHHDFPWVKILGIFTRVSTATAAMAIALILGSRVVDPSIFSAKGVQISKLVWLFSLVVLGSSVFFAVAIAFRIEQVRVIARRIPILKLWVG